MNKLIVILVLALTVAALIFFPQSMVSPGDISVEHAETANDCFACHSSFSGVSSEKCISCHKLEDIGKDSVSELTENKKAQFHQELKDVECATCHTEHKGNKASLTLNDFDHSILPVTIVSTCVNCHAKPINDFHKKFESDCKSCHSSDEWEIKGGFKHDLIVATERENCISCHVKPSDDFHSMVANECASCHQTTKWEPSTFNHSNFFVLDRDHNVKCSTCHNTGSLKSYSCFGCHEHSTNKLREEHSEEGITNIDNCVSCHKSADEDEAHGKGSKENDDD